jgi:hypothetical protein
VEGSGWQARKWELGVEMGACTRTVAVGNGNVRTVRAVISGEGVKGSKNGSR